MQIIKAKRPLQLVKRAPFAPKDSAAASHGNRVAGDGGYYARIERYAQQIRQTHDVTEIINILNRALLETQALHSGDEMRTAREQVQRAEQQIKSLKDELEQLKELVHADHLTGALNRSGLDEAYAREAARADRRDIPLCMALLDLDDFKQFNDTSGHVVGDNALRHLVNVAKETLRPNDIIARFGGEEFVILMPDTVMDSAMLVIYRLQRDLAASCCLHAGLPLPITFSAGVTPRTPYERQSTVIGRADEALYEAKRAGKNRVLAAPW